LSSLCEETEDEFPDEDGIIFLKKMFEDTKTIAEPKAERRPRIFDAENSEEHAIMTPNVKGSNDMYVWREYRTRNNSAYAATVNKGDSAFMVWSVLTDIRAMATLEKI